MTYIYNDEPFLEEPGECACCELGAQLNEDYLCEDCALSCQIYDENTGDAA